MTSGASSEYIVSDNIRQRLPDPIRNDGVNKDDSNNDIYIYLINGIARIRKGHRVNPTLKYEKKVIEYEYFPFLKAKGELLATVGINTILLDAHDKIIAGQISGHVYFLKKIIIHYD